MSDGCYACDGPVGVNVEQIVDEERHIVYHPRCRRAAIERHDEKKAGEEAGESVVELQRSIFFPTHAELVERAERWLRNTRGCGVVFGERRGGTGHEVPDAIGWKGVRSILVECKVSRSDFFRDRMKPHRLDGTLGMGQARFYFTRPNLLRPADLPPGWGLLEHWGKTVRVIVDSRPSRLDPARYRWELAYLVSAMRRVQLGVEPTHGIVAHEKRRRKS